MGSAPARPAGCRRCATLALGIAVVAVPAQVRAVGPQRVDVAPALVVGEEHDPVADPVRVLQLGRVVAEQPGELLDGSAAPERLPYGPATRSPPAPAARRARHRPAPGRRDLEALPRRHRRQAVDRPGRQRHVRAAARRQPGASWRTRTGSATGSCSSPTTRAGATSTRSAPTAPTCAGTATTATRYARALRTDGTRVGLPGAGDLWLLDGLDGASRAGSRSDLAGPAHRAAAAPGRRRATRSATSPSTAPAGPTAVEVLGTVHWLTTRDGPAPALADTPGVRARLPQVLGPAATAETAPPHVAWITDAEGDDALEVGPADGSADRPAPARRRPARPGAGAGRRPRTAPGWRWPRTTAGCWSSTSPPARSGRSPAPSTSDASGLAWSPGLGLAGLVAPGPGGRCARSGPAGSPTAPTRSTVEVTPLRFVDTDPVFTARRPAPGLPVHPHLRPGLRRRGLRPVLPRRHPARTWCRSARPPRRRSTRSRAAGRRATGERAARASTAEDGDAPPQPVLVDAEAIDQRVVPVPVATARASGLRAVKRRPGLAGDAAGRPARRGPGHRRRRAGPARAGALRLRASAAPTDAGRRARRLRRHRRRHAGCWSATATRCGWCPPTGGSSRTPTATGTRSSRSTCAGCAARSTRPRSGGRCSTRPAG